MVWEITMRVKPDPWPLTVPVRVWLEPPAIVTITRRCLDANYLNYKSGFYFLSVLVGLTALSDYPAGFVLQPLALAYLATISNEFWVLESTAAFFEASTSKDWGTDCNLRSRPKVFRWLGQSQKVETIRYKPLECIGDSCLLHDD
jgi:hypothetical protein